MSILSFTVCMNVVLMDISSVILSLSTNLHNFKFAISKSKIVSLQNKIGKKTANPIHAFLKFIS
jgi:hypothetical protein